ncbi:hypothetical protein NEAUS03_0095 [Nematocida ausubeli]|nr:hypothetical protein NEAUS03_0095 [Nematocida ausubeli]
MHMGYLLLPEEQTELLNDTALSYSLATNAIESIDKPAISNPLFIFDNSMIEILTSNVNIESALYPTEEDLVGVDIPKDTKECDEIEYKVEIDFTKIGEEYELIGIEKEQSDVMQINSIGQYLYEVSADNAKYVTKCATVDDNLYIVLTDTGTAYSIDKSCVVRKQNDRRLEDV